MKEINYKEMKFNPFNLIGGEWMLMHVLYNVKHWLQSIILLSVLSLSHDGGTLFCYRNAGNGESVYKKITK